MGESMYIPTDEFGPRAFNYPRGSLTGIIDRPAEERRTSHPVGAGDETGVPSRYRLVESETTGGEAARGMAEPHVIRAEEAPFKMPNKNEKRHLGHTLDRKVSLIGQLRVCGWPVA